LKNLVVKEYKQQIENLKEENERLAKIRESNRRERLTAGKAKRLGLIDQKNSNG